MCLGVSRGQAPVQNQGQPRNEGEKGLKVAHINIHTDSGVFFFMLMLGVEGDLGLAEVQVLDRENDADVEGLIESGERISPWQR